MNTFFNHNRWLHSLCILLFLTKIPCCQWCPHNNDVKNVTYCPMKPISLVVSLWHVRKTMQSEVYVNCSERLRHLTEIRPTQTRPLFGVITVLFAYFQCYIRNTRYIITITGVVCNGNILFPTKSVNAANKMAVCTNLWIFMRF